MSRIRKKDQIDLRGLLGYLGYGQSEAEDSASFVRRFYPVAEHLRAFDPDVGLVVGERGTGKSALFRAVFENQMLPALARHARAPRLPSEDPSRVTWVQAHPLGGRFPDALGLRRCLEEGDIETSLKLWFAFLVRALQDNFPHGQSNNTLKTIWEPPGGAPRRILEAFDTAADEPLLVLDDLDRQLLRDDRWIFVGYDELDTLGGYNWEAMRRALLGLISFWASYSRRWQRLRPKIFLRTDLFRRHAKVGGADLAKLAANRVDLTWSDLNLYSMLIKRIANTDDKLYEYCRGGKSKIRFKAKDTDLGYIPDLLSDQEARSFIERMVGQFMGASASKGRTFTWILDHLRDARKHVAPRNLVRLIEQASIKDAVNTKAVPPRLIHSTALRQALEDISADHVRQGVNNEWPWLHGLEHRVQGNLMPMERDRFRDLLSFEWDKSWGSVGDIRPPEESAKEFLEYLLELGILRERSKDRIDVPDIYLYGLGLKRKGGVATRKKA